MSFLQIGIYIVMVIFGLVFLGASKRLFIIYLIAVIGYLYYSNKTTKNRNLDIKVEKKVEQLDLLNITYPPNEIVLTQENKESLELLLKKLKKDEFILISGFSDSDEYLKNQNLAIKRTEEIKKFCENYGIKSKQILIRDFATDYLFPNDNLINKARNRRVKINFVKLKD